MHRAVGSSQTQILKQIKILVTAAFTDIKKIFQLLPGSMGWGLKIGYSALSYDFSTIWENASNLEAFKYYFHYMCFETRLLIWQPFCIRHSWSLFKTQLSVYSCETIINGPLWVTDVGFNCTVHQYFQLTTKPNSVYVYSHWIRSISNWVSWELTVLILKVMAQCLHWEQAVFTRCVLCTLVFIYASIRME